MDNKKSTTITVPMYCVKCRSKVIVTGPKLITWPNGKKAIEGHCPHCNTKTFKVVKSTFTLEG
jgi:Zn finger protein HypA/HybF involved in hydrogenase expression